MTFAELLAKIQDAGITIAIDNLRLRLDPTPCVELLELIRAHKLELMAYSVATLTANLPEDPALRSEVHRLLDTADELDRAGDEPGMVRILDDIARLVRNSTAAREAGEAPRTGRVGKDEATAGTTSPRASNAKS
ncbi:MAG TPA: hypothetical protein PLP29_09425 [Candidatus Ozemobacteraceae bacterium]|nr:hypothetical protein [Candidatus Ozemobacteraceae bacterium]